MSTRSVGCIKKRLIAIAAAGMLFQLGSCDMTEITVTTTTTLDTREVFISLMRGAIITPIDDFLTDRINALIDELQDE